MTESKFALLIDGVQIPAVLLASPGARAAVLLIPGSLNSDVDGNYAPMFPGQPAMLCHVYKDLAEQLAAQGLAVLRFAKRGPGTGCVTVDEAEAAQKYRTFPQRIRVAGVFLDELKQRAPGLPCFLAGHSEGSAVATLLAQQRDDLAGVVLLSGPALPLFRLMMRQRFESERKAGQVTADSESQYQEALKWLDDFAADRPLPADLSVNPYGSMLAFAAQPQNAPYLRSLEQVDPAAELSKVAQPTLIVQGGRDSSVFAENATELQRAKPGAEIRLFPDLQHMYKRVPEGLSAQESFAQTSESDPAVAAAIAEWILANAGG